MTKDEAREILNRYEGRWNMAQRSVSLAFNGVRTPEDDILDERRELMRKATRVIAGAEPETAQ